MVKALDTPTVQKRIPRKVVANSVVIVDDDEKDEDLGPHTVDRKRLSQETASFASCLKDTGKRSKEASAGPEGKVSDKAPDTQD